MTRSNEILLEASDLSIGYAKQRRGALFDGLNLRLVKGTLTCLMGPNGSGKSTLIKTLTGLLQPLDGRIEYGGDGHLLKYPRKRAKAFSVVLTGNSTTGMLRVREVVAIGRHPHTKWTGMFSKQDLSMVQWALEAVHAEELADRWLHTLSDGERQRVMVARALAQDTPIIYLDEPTAYLDLPHKIELMHILRKLARDCGLTLLMSTHELEMALQHADQLWLLGHHGRCECGLPEDLLLDGKLEAVFSRSNLSFDRERGVFTSLADVHRYVQLIGDPVAVKWTKNALRKLGVGVHSGEFSGTSLVIEVISSNLGDRSSYRWKSTVMGGDDVQDQEGTSIQSLLHWLRLGRQEVFADEGFGLPVDVKTG